VIEFRTNGLRQSELCRIHGLTRWTLQRDLRRERIGCGSQGEVKGLVVVEVTDVTPWSDANQKRATAD
jgi:hypothetical protein